MTSKKKTEKKSEQKGGKSSFWLYAAACISIVAVAMATLGSNNSLIGQFTHALPTQKVHPTTSSGSAASPRNSNEVKAKKTRGKGVPTYEEYIAMSIENNWKPADPVEKLEATVAKYGQLFDVVDATDEAVVEQSTSMMGQEVKHLLTILSKATHREIYLTSILHKSIDIVQEITYRSLKNGLSTNSRVMTRSEITNNLNHWMYTPLRELVKLSASRLPQIRIDHNARNATSDGATALTKVVKHRLYGLISVFLELGADAVSITESMHVSIIQGDDLALSLILNGLARVYPHIQMEVRRNFDSLIELAEKLHSKHMLKRLQSVLVKQVAGTQPLPITNAYMPYSLINVSTMCSDGVQCPSQPLHSGISPAGYMNPQFSTIVPSQSVSDIDEKIVHDDKVSSNLAMTRNVPYCAIDELDIRTTPTSTFLAEYVKLNQPVILVGAQNPSSAEDTNTVRGIHENSDPWRVWTLDGLLEVMGSVNEVSGVIPYATLFGEHESVNSLHDFVYQESTGMRAYSRKVASYLSDHTNTHSSFCCENTELRFTVSDNMIQEIVGLHGKPQYIFSGVQQALNQVMRPHMLQATQAFGNLSASDLLSYMHAVSELGENNFTHHGDFKPHWKSQFYLGPALSGAPFHHHGPAFNMLIHGRKQWTLLPPGRDVYTRIHPTETLFPSKDTSWFPYIDDLKNRVESLPSSNTKTCDVSNSENGECVHTVDRDELRQQDMKKPALNNDQPCQIIQKAGQVLFVPRHWTHQVLNLGESVGFAVEIDDYKI